MTPGPAIVQHIEYQSGSTCTSSIWLRQVGKEFEEEGQELTCALQPLRWQGHGPNAREAHYSHLPSLQGTHDMLKYMLLVPEFSFWNLLWMSYATCEGDASVGMIACCRGRAISLKKIDGEQLLCWAAVEALSPSGDCYTTAQFCHNFKECIWYPGRYEQVKQALSRSTSRSIGDTPKSLAEIAQSLCKKRNTEISHEHWVRGQGQQNQPPPEPGARQEPGRSLMDSGCTGRVGEISHSQSQKRLPSL